MSLAEPVVSLILYLVYVIFAAFLHFLPPLSFSSQQLLPLLVPSSTCVLLFSFDVLLFSVISFDLHLSRQFFRYSRICFLRYRMKLPLNHRLSYDRGHIQFTRDILRNPSDHSRHHHGDVCFPSMDIFHIHDFDHILRRIGTEQE